MSDELIRKEAIQNIERLYARVNRLESNDYFRPFERSGAVSNPPTSAEITAILGTPTSFGSEMIGMINDTGSARYWGIVSDKVNWYYWLINIAL